MSTVGTGAMMPGSVSHIRVCSHCGMRYDWRRSPSSSLKMTYCGTLCERADLGYTIDALLQFQAPKRGEPIATATASPADAAVDIYIGDDAEARAGLIAA